jgi:DNA-binding MarR family transcriptional regulator
MSDSNDGPPLARLFAIAYRQLIDTLHERLRQQGWSDLRAGFGFVLLAVRDHPMTVNELAGTLDVSKQATSKLIDVMTTAGYVERRIGRDDARQRDVVLTARGRKLLREVERIYVDLEAEWAAVIGDRAVGQIRTSLVRVLSQPGDVLPPVRPATDALAGLTSPVGG